MAEKLKLADIRRMTPNPVEGLTGFEPDNTGDGVIGAAQSIIVNMILKRGHDALKHIDADPKSKYAREKLSDASDTNNWALNQGDWDPNAPEPPKLLEPPKKKRRR